MKTLALLLFFMFSGFVHAATFAQAMADCNTNGTAFHNANPSYSYTCTDKPANLYVYKKIIYTATGSEFSHSSYPYTNPICTSPEVFVESTHTCHTPIECTWPETDNGDGICANHQCPEGQNRNPITKLCQTPPVCGDTETYNPQTNTCENYPLRCPEHSHANAANDQCLPDAPLVCPTGQHDDGTYNCVADDAKRCASNEYSGYINGVHQCVKKPNLDTAQKAAKDKAESAKLAQQAANDASQAAITANNNLAADPTNPALQAIANQANDNAQALQHKADNANADAAQAAADAQIQGINSISRNTDSLISGNSKKLTTVEESTFDNAIPINAVETAKTEYEAAFSTIRGQVQSLFTFEGSGSGSLPVFDLGTIHGVHVVVDFNQYATPLSYVGYTFMFFAVFIAVRILIG